MVKLTTFRLKIANWQKVIFLPSRRIPILRHFRNLQYWHWFLWCWSMGQVRFPRQEYVKLRRTDRLKNDLQPGGEKWETNQLMHFIQKKKFVKNLFRDTLNYFCCTTCLKTWHTSIVICQRVHNPSSSHFGLMSYPFLDWFA